VQLKTADGIVADKRTNHKHIAVSKVDQFDNAVNHCIAKRNQGIYKAKLQAIDNLIKEQWRRLQRLYRKSNHCEQANGINEDIADPATLDYSLK